MGTLTIFASGNKADIDQVNKKDGKQIADAIRARFASSPSPHQSAPQSHHVPQAVAGADVYEQIRKLGELRDLGVVAPEEFAAHAPPLHRGSPEVCRTAPVAASCRTPPTPATVP